MSFSVVDASDVEPVWGVFRPVRAKLGGGAFGMNQIDFGPDHVGVEHDELESRQEEIYVVLSGSGRLEVDGETVELRPGRYVLVSPDARRRPIAGPEGITMLCVGGVVGAPYPVGQGLGDE
jgi:quercetin dioxygenase-like cupin family protein